MLYQLLFGRERLTSVTVHERPDHARDRISRAEDLTFVKDGFDWNAFVLPPAFFVQHKLWIGILLYAAALAGIAALHFILGLPEPWIVIGVIALHALIGWEADEMVRSRLDARGWSLLGQATGSSLLDCERRFLDGWLASVPIGAGPQAHLSMSGEPEKSAPDRRHPQQTGQADGRFKRILGNVLAPRTRH